MFSFLEAFFCSADEVIDKHAAIKEIFVHLVHFDFRYFILSVFLQNLDIAFFENLCRYKLN